MRHAIPKIVADFDEAAKIYHEGPPKCCHTCEFYDVKGTCTAFFMEPPEDFASTTDACSEYEGEIPF